MKQIGKKCDTFNSLTSCELKSMQYTRNLFFIFFSAQARTSFPISTHGNCSANFWQVVDTMFPSHQVAHLIHIMKTIKHSKTKSHIKWIEKYKECRMKWEATKLLSTSFSIYCPCELNWTIPVVLGLLIDTR